MGLDAIVIRRLRRTELPINTVELARELVGRVLAHDLPEGRISGRIVETEAYVVGDASGHAFHGPTPRNRSLFLERGHAYVYRAYGISYLLNVSSELPGVGAGVLLRALEPLEGIAAMMRHRGTSRILDLARGPGRLAAAMRIDRRCDGADLCAGGPLWLGAVAARWAHRSKRSDRSDPRGRPVASLLRARQSVREWSEAAPLVARDEQWTERLWARHRSRL